jgi:hypothetical protein
MTDSDIGIYLNRRRELLSVILFGCFAAIGIGGLVTDTRVSVAAILLVAFGPLFVLAIRRTARPGPVLILGKHAVTDPRRNVQIRWENIEEARVTEVRGAFGNYHHLHLSGSVSNGGDGLRKDDSVELIPLERLSVPWEQVLAQIERRLPASTALHRAQRMSARSTVA